ncbi:hypothetical protein KTC96_02535 [Clostridium estertheticum]|uniref:hypothetical protein n=1 Tax=Clostridium estertheticum TaxID=238834 RepID=UPI001C7CC647|nr:hypothetical protein [Clostridium estertheticum]MBX4261569.1 hypothetical protein [Clostridium estertheticum]WLC70931.1 hypothetical protein KTC96_02535 [Clostridium estertheticum]
MLSKQTATYSNLGIQNLQIKEFDYDGYTYHYSVGGCGPKNILILLSNYAGEYLALPIKTGGHTPMFTKTEEYKKILLDFLLN